MQTASDADPGYTGRSPTFCLQTVSK